MPDVGVKKLPGVSGMLPGPGMAGELAELPLGALDEHALVEVMRAARRLTSWAESLELSAVAELDRRRTAQVGRYGGWTVEMSRALCDEVAAALTLSGAAAAMRLGLASMLAGPLAETGRALAEGRIDAAKARVICDGVLGIDHEVARRVEGMVLDDAPRLTARQLAIRVRKAIIDVDPQAYERRRRAAERGRRVEVHDNPDGTADLAARDLPAADADAAYNYVNALANALKADGDGRPIDAIRADLVLELLRGRHPAGLFPAESEQDAPAQATATAPEEPASADTGTPAEPRVSRQAIGHPAGARRSEFQRPDRSDGDSGRQEAAAIARVARDGLSEVLGHGPAAGGPVERRLLVAEAARRMKDALSPLKLRWCALAVDTDGNPIHGHHGYRPPAGMRRLIHARDGTCTFPTCDRPVERCDLDHTARITKAARPAPAISPHCAAATIYSSNTLTGH